MSISSSRLNYTIGATQGPMTSLIAYSWYFWVLPSELTIANAGANIGGAFGAVTIAVVAAQMLANNYGWVELFYVTGSILGRV